MKICVTATGDKMTSTVDPRFGRCSWFILVDTETMEFKALANPNESAVGGAGIQSAQLIAKEGVQAVVTGNVGPNASTTLSSLGVKTYIGASGTVEEAVRQYKEGKLKEASGPSVPGHFGSK